MKLVDRMREAAKAAGFGVSDMSVWFEVSRASMHTWLHDTREPSLGKSGQLEDLLTVLEKVISSELEIFPIPLSVRQYERKEYIQKVKHAAGELLSVGATSRGREMLGINKQG